MARSVSGTLTPDEVATVTVSGAMPGGGIEIINRSQSGTIWVRCDGYDPEVAGTSSHPVLGARRIPYGWFRGSDVEVRMISDEALAYTVEVDPAVTAP